MLHTSSTNSRRMRPERVPVLRLGSARPHGQRDPPGGYRPCHVVSLRDHGARPGVALAIAIALIVGCAPVGPPAVGAPSPDPARATPSPATPMPTPAATPRPEPAPDAPIPLVRLEPVAAPAFRSMTGLHQMPDGRWLVLEQPGRILAFREGDARASVFLDLEGVLYGGEQGLLGLALAPDFARSGVFFVHYVADGPRRVVIASFTSSTAGADPRSRAVVLQVPQPYANHKGGQLAFGPDGHLYVALGDGGSAGDPHGHGQNVDSLLGKLLRLDVRDRTRYAVPPDNPFVGGRGRPEIWAYGLRNPWRFSFDTATGTLWLGDVGQQAWEEVNIVTRGGNYGWNVMEGPDCFRAAVCDRTGLIPPVFGYPTRGGNCSVIGGYVYRGAALPELRGAYVYGDHCSGRVWALRHAGGRVTVQSEIAVLDGRISSLAQDRDGEIYVLQHALQGRVFRLAAPGR